ncbi:MAG: flagellar basal body rod protein FlgB [Peptococcaceae bacterium]|nr:flagellar basal body rod protein FlgB [Peptococcaceae bacterium]
MDIFTSPHVLSLKKGLDAGALRQKVIANNIANVNTPYFKKSRVAFESILKKSLDRDSIALNVSHPRHLGSFPQLAAVQPEVNLIEATSMRTDENNVDLDEEMTNLAANDIQFQAVGRVLSDHYSLLSLVITGRG